MQIPVQGGLHEKGHPYKGGRLARIRTIKPEFWSDPALIECSVSARLLFIGLWNFADDYGNIEAHPVKVKAVVFPADNVQVEPLLAELEKWSLIRVYEISGRKYVNIRSFLKHQRINRPSKAQCPLYEDSLRVHGAFNEHSSPEGKGKERKGKDTPLKPPPESALPFLELFPEAFRNDDSFKKAWASWAKYRREKKHPLTEEAVKRQAAKLAPLGPEEAVRWIENAIDREWRGIYSPKERQEERDGRNGKAGRGCEQASRAQGKYAGIGKRYEV